MSAVSTVPGGVSLFLVDPQGAVQSSYFDPRVANPQWAPWFRVSPDGLAPAGSVVSAVSTVPGGVSLFLVDPQGAVQSSYFDPRVANPQWAPWFRVSPDGLAPAGSVVSAVSTVPGGVSLFLVDPQGAVQSSYFDPRVANPQWAPWFHLSEGGSAHPGAAVSVVSSIVGGASLFFVDPHAGGAVDIFRSSAGNVILEPVRDRRLRLRVCL